MKTPGIYSVDHEDLAHATCSPARLIRVCGVILFPPPVCASDRALMMPVLMSLRCRRCAILALLIRCLLFLMPSHATSTWGAASSSRCLCTHRRSVREYSLTFEHRHERGVVNVESTTRTRSSRTKHATHPLNPLQRALQPLQSLSLFSIPLLKYLDPFL